MHALDLVLNVLINSHKHQIVCSDTHEERQDKRAESKACSTLAVRHALLMQRAIYSAKLHLH